jgi:hypothetical protein
LAKKEKVGGEGGREKERILILECSGYGPTTQHRVHANMLWIPFV